MSGRGGAKRWAEMITFLGGCKIQKKKKKTQKKISSKGGAAKRIDPGGKGWTCTNQRKLAFRNNPRGNIQK